MKKFISILVLAICTLGIFAQAAEIPETVEISFKVGDETLIINGVETTVEKPYVVGVGVTLVPLRVITEAFGAEVVWDGETKSITLTYPDVNILLQINNPLAEVNGIAETLLSPPELTVNGFTMVPLRFISETFGADVAYDEATAAITVTKKSGEAGSTVIDTVITESRIGDSYYNWSMENSSEYEMVERSFDGRSTVFEHSNGSIFDITIMEKTENYSFDKVFEGYKSMVSGFTLIKADKNTASKSIHIQAKDAEGVMNILFFETAETLFAVEGAFFSEDAAAKDEGIRLMSPFKTDFGKTDVHDLSNVKDGMREYKNETLKASLTVPHNYTVYESGENRVDFYPLDEDDYVSGIALIVYSKSDEVTAELLAKTDYSHNKQVLNESLTTFKEIEKKDYAEFSAYQYEYTIVGSAEDDCASLDVFFELGDYVYNILVDVKLPNDGAAAFADKIINSLKVEELDKEEMGVILRNIPDSTTLITNGTNRFTVELPASFEVADEAEYQGTYVDRISGCGISVMVSPNSESTTTELKTQLKELEKSYKTQPGTTVVSSVTDKTIDGVKYSTLVLKTTSEGTNYATIYVGKKGTTEVFVATEIPERTTSTAIKAAVEKIIKSIKVK